MKHHALTLLFFAFLLAACVPETTTERTTKDNGKNTEQQAIINNDEGHLESRVSYADEIIPIEQEGGASQKALDTTPSLPSTPTLTLVSEIAPPSHDGQTLQATEVFVKSSKAFVSYNVQGTVSLGAIDVFDITIPTQPVLISSALFPNMDINAVHVVGEDLYFAAASDDPSLSSPAVFGHIKLWYGRLTDEMVTVDIPSFAGTDVSVINDFIYVTSGADNGHVTLFDKSSLTIAMQTPIDDARGIDIENDTIVAVTGTPSSLVTFDAATHQALDQVTLLGATIPNSKSTVEIIRNKAFLSAGDGGLKVVCVDPTDPVYGNEIAHIAPPQLADLATELTVTNAVTAHKYHAFMANGEAGVYIAAADVRFDSKNCAISNLRELGKLRFKQHQSVNHVVYRSDLLFIATGTGGLKVLTVQQ